MSSVLQDEHANIYIVGWGVDLFLDVKQGCISSPGSHKFPGDSLFQPFQTKSLGISSHWRKQKRHSWGAREVNPRVIHVLH